MLFFRLTPQVHGGGVYGAGRGAVVLDEVGCGGAESSVLLCPHSGLRVHDCGHHEDVGLDCQPPGAGETLPFRLSVSLHVCLRVCLCAARGR